MSGVGARPCASPRLVLCVAHALFSRGAGRRCARWYRCECLGASFLYPAPSACLYGDLAALHAELCLAGVIERLFDLLRLCWERYIGLSPVRLLNGAVYHSAAECPGHIWG